MKQFLLFICIKMVDANGTDYNDALREHCKHCENFYASYLRDWQTTGRQSRAYKVYINGRQRLSTYNREHLITSYHYFRSLDLNDWINDFCRLQYLTLERQTRNELHFQTDPKKIAAFYRQFKPPITIKFVTMRNDIDTIEQLNKIREKSAKDFPGLPIERITLVSFGLRTELTKLAGEIYRLIGGFLSDSAVSWHPQNGDESECSLYLIAFAPAGQQSM